MVGSQPAQRTGLREYGTLAKRYVREFDTEWLRQGAPSEEPLVGSADVQSANEPALAELVSCRLAWPHV